MSDAPLARPELVEGPHFLGAGINTDLADILGTICFRIILIADAYRQAGLYVDDKGNALRSRAEEEQAFVIHRQLVHYARNPEGWRAAWAQELEEVFKAARQRRAAHG